MATIQAKCVQEVEQKEDLHMKIQSHYKYSIHWLVSTRKKPNQMWWFLEPHDT
jgi:hypothetical protein